jgi:hypothetical protein
MARITPLWRSDAISLHRFDHPPEHEDRAYEAVADVFSASFVDRGSFDLQSSSGAGAWGGATYFCVIPACVTALDSRGTDSATSVSRSRTSAPPRTASTQRAAGPVPAAP